MKRRIVGTSELVCALVASVALFDCSGSSGDPGAQGAPGAPGTPGAAGAAGAAGADGTNGHDGADGSAGANGANGDAGANAPTAGPTAFFTSTPASVATSAAGSIAFSCTTGDCTYECRLDTAAYAACTSPVALSGLGPGAHTFAVVAATHGADGGAGVSSEPASYTWKVKSPNILYIMADDLGYSDIHAFGGEIDTPNLDALVGSGRLLTNHHAGTVSAITRAMLVSGTDHHLVGEGTMGAPSDERKGLPGYEGYLNDRALSVAQLLKDAGYHTYIAGKWHIGSGIAGSPAGGGSTPDQWGFERSFSLLGGAASNHFFHEPANSKNYVEDGAYVQPGQPGQTSGYSTDVYTQKLIGYIDSNHGDGKPFFAYAAYTSPHWPLQAPEPWLSKYRGKYSQGYDAIRNARLARQRSLGVIPNSWTPFAGAPETLTASPATPNYGKAGALYTSAVHNAADGYTDYRAGLVDKAWASLSPAEQAAQARYMEIFAAMVSNLDNDIGLLVQHLVDIGEYDNTFIMFQSDNGAEGWPIDSGADPTATDTANAAILDKLGTDSGLAAAQRLQYGLRWAEVSATPLSQVKGQLGEGGVSVPAFVHLPGQTTSLPPVRVFTHVTDDTATFLALAGVTPPSQPAPPLIDSVTGVDKNAGKVVYDSRYVYPVTGKSLLAALKAFAPAPVHTTPFGDESYGRAYLFSADGQWKARWTEPPFGPQDGHWELFAIGNDRGETNDVSSQNASVVTTLTSQWGTYLTGVGGVEPLQPRGFY